MRYTTIIDISEYARLYRNQNVRMLYLHLALVAGWHDTDRDLANISIREMAYRTGLTVSAVRNALRQLENAKLVTREGSVWRVVKWVQPEEVTPRPKGKKHQAVADREADQQERDARLTQQRAEREQMEASGRTPYMVYYEAKLKEAEAGDPEAQEIVRRGRATYESHKKQVEERNRKKQ